MIALGIALAAASCIAIEGDRILARDLAQAAPAFAAAPAGTVLGYAPGPGARRIIDAGQLKRLADRFGVEMKEPAAALCVELASEPLTPERLTAAMKTALEVEGAPIEIVDFLHGAVPRGELVLPRTGLADPNPGKADAPRLWRGYVRYAGDKRFPVWATARLPAQYQAVLVEVLRGDTVAVEVRSGAAQLRFDARAESSAPRGGFVTVRNPASGKVFRAAVEGKGKVAVRVPSVSDRRESQ